MNINLTRVTPEEIARFRAELENYPDSRVTTALNVIEKCEGELEDAVPLLLLKETGIEPDRSIDDLLKRFHQFICQKEVREAIESGAIAPAIEPISIGAGIPPGAATAIGILAFKLTIKKVCGDCDN